MNILLNNYCNLQCPYCFQWKVLKQKHQNITIENFKWLLNFLEKSNEHEVRLIGGEPTLHPQFIEILQEQLFDDNIERIHIFTNGTFNERILKQIINQNKIKKVSLLLNINDLSIYPNKTLDENLKKNIKLMKLNGVQMTQGINIYDKNQDFSYFFEIVDEFQIKDIRWTITTPTHLENFDMIEYFKERYPKQKEFLKIQIDKRLFPHPDCNNIPNCVWDNEMYQMFSVTLPQNIENRSCNVVLDVQPDMKVIRCFMFSEYPIDIKKFKNTNELREFFINNIDKKLEGVFKYNYCKNCYFYKINKHSCGCKQFYKSQMNIDKTKFDIDEGSDDDERKIKFHI